MIIGSIIAVLLLYRYYLFYKKRNDKRILFEERRIYLGTFFPLHFHFYSQLDQKDQKEFIKRVQMLENEKNIFGETVVHVDDNLKLLICATFIQLTFGFRGFPKEHYFRVFMYPRMLFSRIFHRDSTTIATTPKNIQIAWDEYQKGYMYDPEKLKLAIRELAIALKQTYFERDGVHDATYERWQVAASILRKGEPSTWPFSTLDYQDENAFFAVAVLQFFDAPQKFKTQYEELFYILSALFHIDPGHLSNEQQLNG